MKKTSTDSRRTFLQQLAVLPVAMQMPSAITRKNSTSATADKRFVPVMITPFRRDLSIDWTAFDQLVSFYQNAGAKAYFANCLSSEMYMLSPDERLAVTNRTIKVLGGTAPVVATGSFGATLSEKSEFVKKVAGLGADAVILVTSHFADREDSDEKLIANLETIMNQTGTIALGTYESPNPYKRLLSTEVYKLLAGSGRFIYHKDTSEQINQIREKLRGGTGSKLQLYNAHTGTAVASLKSGAAGLSPISGNFYPEIHAWLCREANNPKKQKDVDWIQAEIAKTEPIISRGYPMSSKYFLAKRGLRIEPICRLERSLPDETQRKILDQVYDRFLNWCERCGIHPVPP